MYGNWAAAVFFSIAVLSVCSCVGYTVHERQDCRKTEVQVGKTVDEAIKLCN